MRLPLPRAIPGCSTGSSCRARWLGALLSRLGEATQCESDRNPSRETAGRAAGRVALVVDDEPMILEILSEFCASLGMKVYEAPDGEGALRRVETNPEIEVLVTDIRMPGLDGPGLVNRALGSGPGSRSSL